MPPTDFQCRYERFFATFTTFSHMETFVERFRFFLLGNSCRSNFRQHIEYQLKIGHIIKEVLFLQVLQFFVFFHRHIAPCLCHFICQDSIILLLINTSPFPLIRNSLASQWSAKLMIQPSCNLWPDKIGTRDGFSDLLSRQAVASHIANHS